MKELISIVVPVYNAERYVSDCLRSLAYQDYENFEVIVVDDGSTDESFDICKDFIEQSDDKRFRLFHKQNGGLADARNYGIAHCSQDSKYVVFVDSDDEITPDCLSQLVENAGADTLVIGLMVRCITKPEYVNCDDSSESHFFENAWKCQKFLENLKYGIINSVCANCYSLDTIRKYGITFKNTLPEDTLFNIAYTKHTDKVFLLNRVVYYYFIRSQSMSTNPEECIYVNYLRIQQELYDMVTDEMQKYIDLFVYPQYRRNTEMYILNNDFDTPQRYLSEILIQRSMKAYAPVSFGDRIVHFLMRHKMFKLLTLVLRHAEKTY